MHLHEPVTPVEAQSGHIPIGTRVNEGFQRMLRAGKDIFHSERFVPIYGMRVGWAGFTCIAVFLLGVSAAILALCTRFSHPTIFPPSDPRLGNQSGPTTRGTATIILSCLLTIYTCTYAVYHPRATLAIKDEFKNKLKMWGMVALGLLAPEILFFFSILELDRAWKHTQSIRKMDPKLQRWSMAMSFAAADGVFVKVPGGIDPWLPETIRRRIEEIQAAGTSITLDFDYIELKLRSWAKQNTLGKVLAVAQVLRLGIQMIARAKEGLTITPLELVTCGYVFLATGTYAAWLYKPYRLQGRIWMEIKPEVESKMVGVQVDRLGSLDLVLDLQTSVCKQALRDLLLCPRSLTKSLASHIQRV